jgi:hypothetical protein
VQLVAEVERELEVLVGERIGAAGQHDRRQVMRRLAQRGEQRLRGVAARGRQLDHSGAVFPLGDGCSPDGGRQRPQ